MMCTGEHVTAGVSARPIFGTHVPPDFREVESIQRRYCYGRPGLVVTFTNGESCTTPTDATWEIDQ